MIARSHYKTLVGKALARSPIVALLGPRQCGKTTLAREFLDAAAPQYFDLEDPLVAQLFDNPRQLLSPLRGLIVIDEAQRRPDLFPLLRVLADRDEAPARFLILGSASPELARQSSESLAGRVEIIELKGFDLGEVGNAAADTLWLRGGFPRSFLARDDEDSRVWRRQFIATFLERDLAALGFGMSPALMGRFWTMLAHYHGQIWNGSEIAASLGVAPNTARAWLDALEQTFMVRRLLPWHANLGKRLVKSPKLYFRDTGLLHALLGIHDTLQLLTHPKLGASWEGFVIEQTLGAESPEEAWFYGVHGGSELDLLMIKNGRRIGVEAKRTDAPTLTRSMQTAKTDLKLDELRVIYPGPRTYTLADDIIAQPLVPSAHHPPQGAATLLSPI
jgi:predicted AAA+ superfamily ATPase